MKKQEILALLEELPEEFDASQLIYTLSLKHKVERAEADLAAGRLTSQDGAPPTLWEHQRARHRHAEQVLTRVYDNKELMEQAIRGFEASERGERGTPFKEILEQERRQRHEG